MKPSLLLIGLQPALHHVNEELSGIAHRHAQRLARGSELRGHRGKLSAWWGARCSCGQRGLGWQARGAVDEPRTVGYWVGVGTAVAARAADASFTRGSQRALAGSSLASDLSFAATAARLPPLIFTAVRATASCRQSRRHDDYLNVIHMYTTFRSWPIWTTHSHLGDRSVRRQTWPSLWGTLRRAAWRMQTC